MKYCYTRQYQYHFAKITIKILFQIIVSGNDGVPVSAEFDEKAVYVIDGPDGISQVVASAEEFQVRNHLTKIERNVSFLHLAINCNICSQSFFILYNFPKQKLVGEASTTTINTEPEQPETKQDSNENAVADVEEVEEEIPPRKKLRLEKKLRNAEFLFRRRKRDICSKMRQYESEYNQTTRQNNALQLQVVK